MGNTDSKINFRKSVVQLTTRTQPVDASDEAFWSQFWSDSATCVQDVFTLIPAAEIRALREESPSNLATLCYKAVEKLVQVAESGCRATKDEQMVQNCVRLLTRLLPYIFEDPDWRGFFWSTLPGQRRDEEDHNEENSVPLAQSLITALCDLLFCPDFTVSVNKKSGPDNPDDMTSIDSCEFIWAAGVGFTHHPHSSSTIELNRTELLKLLLTCFSETMYLPSNECHAEMNQWISYFTSIENRHALPLFTSLLNVVCSYDPIGYGLPYNYLMFADAREPLVEVALHVLCVSLDCDQMSQTTHSEAAATTPSFSIDGGIGGGPKSASEYGESENLFIIYLSRIHREEDFKFILKGITRLLNNPLTQTYLPGSTKRIHFHQELLVFFWKICDVNKKFMFHVLKSSDVLDILVPVLYYLNDARSDQSRVGLMHIGVFILLLLSGERNFGVRLNKPYNVRVPMDVPVFTGSHADLLIIVFHKIITTGHQKLQPLFDCLLTIIVNVSPYLKTLSMVSSTKLLHLLEAFSTPWFLFASPSNHHLMFFLLEVFNNIIQYQFDGNSNLVYTIIRKRQVFHQLASMPTDHLSICKALNKSNKKIANHKEHLIIPPTRGVDEGAEGEVVVGEGGSMEGSKPATLAEPGTLQATLAATPYHFLKYDHSLVPSLNHLHCADFKNSQQVLCSQFAQNKRCISLSTDKMYKHIELPHRIKRKSLPQSSPSHQHLENLIFLANNHNKDGDDGDDGDGDGDGDGGGGGGGDLKEKHIIGGDGKCGNGSAVRKISLVQLIANHKADPSPKNQSSEVKAKLIELIGIEKMTEKSRAMNLMTEQTETNPEFGPESELEIATKELEKNMEEKDGDGGVNDGGGDDGEVNKGASGSCSEVNKGASCSGGGNGGGGGSGGGDLYRNGGDDGEQLMGCSKDEGGMKRDGNEGVMKRDGSMEKVEGEVPEAKSPSTQSPSLSSRLSTTSTTTASSNHRRKVLPPMWMATPEWVQSWKQKLPLQTIMRLLQVLVPQVEKICIDKGLTDESEIIKFLQHGTLVGLLPVPHPILIRKYQANSGTTMWFRTYMWGVIYLRNVDPPIWYDTDVKLFEIQRV